MGLGSWTLGRGARCLALGLELGKRLGGLEAWAYVLCTMRNVVISLVSAYFRMCYVFCLMCYVVCNIVNVYISIVLNTFCFVLCTMCYVLYLMQHWK